jgi:hypothetical protein
VDILSVPVIGCLDRAAVQVLSGPDGRQRLGMRAAAERQVREEKKTEKRGEHGWSLGLPL